MKHNMLEETQSRVRWDRRDFVKGLTALAGSTGLFAYDAKPAAADPPPEIRKVRLVQNQAICLAPQYLAEELLRLEGFTELEYVTQAEDEPNPSTVVEAGRADITMDGASALLPALDVGRPLVVIAGIHGGCYELFGSDRIRTIRDLKGKNVGITSLVAAEHVYISSMLAYVGMDPRVDVTWVTTAGWDEPMQLFINRKVDAFLGFPPQPQQVRAKKVGHVIVNTSQDRPWSQYFCCMLVGRREFVRNYPVATKRALRAILKATDICAREPERAARYIVNKGYEASYDIALEVVKEVSYHGWRVFDPSDTLRFHALRLHEVEMIKSDPTKLLAKGTDWRFLNELKKELKA